jgi:hypothetical protein
VLDKGLVPDNNATPGIGELIESVKQYVRQETVGPLRGAGRWAAYGAAGAFLIATAGAFLVLGVLRLLQTEFAPTFSGRWMSLVPYVVALLVAILVVVVAASRISKKHLNKEQQ